MFTQIPSHLRHQTFLALNQFNFKPHLSVCYHFKLYPAWYIDKKYKVNGGNNIALRMSPDIEQKMVVLTSSDIGKKGLPWH